MSPYLSSPRYVSALANMSVVYFSKKSEAAVTICRIYITEIIGAYILRRQIAVNFEIFCFSELEDAYKW